MTYLKQPTVAGQNPAAQLVRHGGGDPHQEFPGIPPIPTRHPSWDGQTRTALPVGGRAQPDPSHGHAPFSHPFSAFTVTANHRSPAVGIAGRQSRRRSQPFFHA